MYWQKKGYSDVYCVCRIFQTHRNMKFKSKPSQKKRHYFTTVSVSVLLRWWEQMNNMSTKHEHLFGLNIVTLIIQCHFSMSIVLLFTCSWPKCLINFLEKLTHSPLCCRRSDLSHLTIIHLFIHSFIQLF